MLRRLGFSLAACLLSGCSLVGSGGADYVVRGEVGFLNFKPDGDLSLSNTTVTAKTTVADLGLDNKENDPYAKASFRLGSNELSLSAFQSSFSGSGVVPVSTSFGDIPGGAAVNSNLDITNAKFLYRWYLVDFDFLSVGPGLGIDYFDLDADITAAAIATQDFSVNAPIPMVGISGELRLGPARAFADLYGISINNMGDVDGAVYDLEGGLRITPISNVDVSVGYRVIQIQASGTDGSQAFDVDYKLPGLFFSAAVRF